MILVAEVIKGMNAVAEVRQDEYLDDATGLVCCRACGTPRQKRLTLDGKVYMPRSLCRCQRERREAEEASQRLREQEETIRQLRRTGLPDPMLWNCTFENDRHINPETDKIKRYVDHWEDMYSRSIGLLLTGGVGTGKTFLAACAANALIDRGIPVLMTNLARVLNTLTALYSGDRNQYIDSLNKYSLLIVDDLGMERNSEFALEQVYSVIDSRYRSRQPLIVTTNLSLEELHKPGDMARGRIYSRVLERCVPILVNRTDIRKQKAVQNLEEARKLLGA